MSKIQIRRDTSVNWANNNPVLALGEYGLDTDLNIIKIGDGTLTWSLLDCINRPSSLYDDDQTTKRVNATSTGASVVGKAVQTIQPTGTDDLELATTKYVNDNGADTLAVGIQVSAAGLIEYTTSPDISITLEGVGLMSVNLSTGDYTKIVDIEGDNLSDSPGHNPDLKFISYKHSDTLWLIQVHDTSGASSYYPWKAIIILE